jgi:serine/threonine protein phosphatase 1
MTAEPGRLIAIGNVHGGAHALQTLLDEIVPQPQDRLIFLGDLVDQGRDSAAVLEQLLRLRLICTVDLIQGNHEEMMFAARGGESALRYWENCGGVATLNSYRFGATLKDVPDEHWALLASAVPYVELDRHILTHANYRPDISMAEQETPLSRWGLLEPDLVPPHQSGKTVFVGHTEQKHSEILDLGFVVCIDTACWRHGWLTAIELKTRQVWQASRWGLMREANEPTHRGQVPFRTA